MKKLSALIVLLALMAQGALADSAFPVYEVRAPGSAATIYLYPSIHMADDQAYPISQAAKSAFEVSEFLAVECDTLAAQTNMGTALWMTQRMLLTGGKTITDFIPQELFDEVKAYLTGQGLYLDAYEKYHPFMLVSALETASATEAGLSAEQGLDLYFLREAQNTGKTVVEIESIQEQLTLMIDTMPEAIWPIMLREYLPPSDQKSVVITRLLYDALLLGDATAISGLLAMEEEMFVVAEQAVYDEYSRLLLTERDAKMKDAVLGFFAANQNTFVVVGAAHVLGPTGLVTSLREAGCAVRRVG